MDISFVHIVIETVCCSGSDSRLLFPCGLVSHERKIMIDTNLVVSAVPVKSAPNSGSSDEFIPLPNLTGLGGVFLSSVRLLVDTKQKSGTGLSNSGFCSCALRTNV